MAFISKDLLIHFLFRKILTPPETFLNISFKFLDSSFTLSIRK